MAALPNSLVTSVDSFGQNSSLQNFADLCARIHQEAPASDVQAVFQTNPDALTLVDALAQRRLQGKNKRNTRQYVQHLANKSSWKLQPHQIIFHFGLQAIQSARFLEGLQALAHKCTWEIAKARLDMQHADRLQQQTGPAAAKWTVSDVTAVRDALPESLTQCNRGALDHEGPASATGLSAARNRNGGRQATSEEPRPAPSMISPSKKRAISEVHSPEVERGRGACTPQRKRVHLLFMSGFSTPQHNTVFETSNSKASLDTSLVVDLKSPCFSRDPQRAIGELLNSASRHDVPVDDDTRDDTPRFDLDSFGGMASGDLGNDDGFMDDFYGDDQSGDEEGTDADEEDTEADKGQSTTGREKRNDSDSIAGDARRTSIDNDSPGIQGTISEAQTICQPPSKVHNDGKLDHGQSYAYPSPERAVYLLYPSRRVSDDVMSRVLEIFNPDPRTWLIMDPNRTNLDPSQKAPTERFRVRNLTAAHRMIVWPVYIPAYEHWTIALLNRDLCTVELYDPTHNKKTLRQVGELLCSRIQSFEQLQLPHGQNLSFKPSMCSMRQSDSINCGVFCVVWALHRMQNLAIPLAIKPVVWRGLLSVAIIGTCEPQLGGFTPELSTWLQRTATSKDNGASGQATGQADFGVISKRFQDLESVDEEIYNIRAAELEITQCNKLLTCLLEPGTSQSRGPEELMGKLNEWCNNANIRPDLRCGIDVGLLRAAVTEQHARRTSNWRALRYMEAWSKKEASALASLRSNLSVKAKADYKAQEEALAQAYARLDNLSRTTRLDLF